MSPPQEGFKYNEDIALSKDLSLFVTRVCLQLTITHLAQSPECWYCYYRHALPHPALPPVPVSV